MEYAPKKVNDLSVGFEIDFSCPLWYDVFRTARWGSMKEEDEHELETQADVQPQDDGKSDHEWFFDLLDEMRLG